MTVEFGQRVAAYKERRDLSQKKLGLLMHVSDNKIRKVIKGELELSIDEAIRLRDAIIPSTEKVEFILSSQGFSNSQVEQVTGKPLRDLDEIRHAKRKLKTKNGIEYVVIRY